MSDSKFNIYQRINKVMEAVKYVQKDKLVDAPGVKYKAVTHDQVTSVLRHELVANGIVVRPSIVKDEMLITRDKAAGVLMHLYSATFEIAFINIDDPEDRALMMVNAHASDNGDKAPGKAMSYGTKMACLKMFFLETGENDESRVPDPVTYTAEQKEEFDEILGRNDGRAYMTFKASVGDEVMVSLFNSFPPGKISDGKKHCREVSKMGIDFVEQCKEAVQARLRESDPSVLELTDELSRAEKKLLAGMLSKEEMSQLKTYKEDAK